MASHNIDITVSDTQLGVPTTNDGVMMMFIKGFAISNTLQLDTLYKLTKLQDGLDLGLSHAFDEANGVAMFQQVNDFYNGSLNDGAVLWLVVTAVAGNPYATYVTGQIFQSLVRQTASADPAERAKMIGFCYEVPQTTQNIADFPVDVTNSILSIQAAQKSMFLNYYQWSALLDGYNMSTSVTPSSIITQANKNAYSVSLCITGPQPNGVSGIGLALGRFARISLGHGFGEVADGPVTTNTAYLTNGIVVGENVISGTGGVLVVGQSYIVLNAPIVYNGETLAVGTQFIVVTGHTNFTTSAGGYVVSAGVTPVGNLAQGPNGDFTQLGNKQYLFLCTQFGQSGFYWNDGATCDSVANALSSQEYNRVANALSADALNFFTLQKGQNLPSVPSTGAISPAWVANQQNAFNQQYIVPLVNSGDIVGATLNVTGPTYNADGNLNFTLTITRATILGNVTGIVTFSATI